MAIVLSPQDSKLSRLPRSVGYMRRSTSFLDALHMLSTCGADCSLSRCKLKLVRVFEAGGSVQVQASRLPRRQNLRLVTPHLRMLPRPYAPKAEVYLESGGKAYVAAKWPPRPQECGDAHEAGEVHQCQSALIGCHRGPIRPSCHPSTTSSARSRCVVSWSPENQL
jgi:hypothetical protein